MRAVATCIAEMAVPGDVRATRCSGMPERLESSTSPGSPVSPKRKELRASTCHRPARVCGAARKITRPYETYDRSRPPRTRPGTADPPPVPRSREAPEKSSGVRGARPRGSGTRSRPASARSRGSSQSSPYSVTSRSGSARSTSRASSRRKSAPFSQRRLCVTPSAMNSSGRTRRCAGCPVPSIRRSAIEKEGCGASTSQGESRTRAERIVPSPSQSTAACDRGYSPVAQENCCSGAMSALQSASGPNAFSALRTEDPRRAGPGTVNDHAGIVLPERKSIPSPRARSHFQRAAAARRAVSFRRFPARTNEGRNGAKSAIVSPVSVRNQTVIPPTEPAMSNTHPFISRRGIPGASKPAAVRVPRVVSTARAPSGAPR